MNQREKDQFRVAHARSFKIDDVDFNIPIGVRVNDSDPSPSCGILGKCGRNAITGLVNLKGATLFPDFSFVDLYERSELYGHPNELAQDPYIFKIVPMPYRTWMYHAYFNQTHLLAETSSNDGIMRKVLTERTIDANVHAGRFSSAIFLAPAALASCISADISTVVFTILIAVLTLTFSRLTNHPGAYKLTRILTFAPRLAFLFFAIIRMAQCASDGFFVILAFLVIIICALLDHFLGDGGAFNFYGYHCFYRVLRALPNRVFVCRRDGAAFLDPGEFIPINEHVTGVGDWHREMTLIAEIRGLVVELKALNREDWVAAWEERTNNGKALPYIGLDVFRPGVRTVDCLDLEEAKKGPEGEKAALIALIESPDSPFKQSRSHSRSQGPVPVGHAQSPGHAVS